MKKGSQNLTGLSASVRRRNVAILNQFLSKLSLLWGQCRQLYWLAGDSCLGRLYREQSNLTTRHIDYLGRRIVQLGGIPSLNSGAVPSKNMPGEVRIAEGNILASLRQELQAVSVGGDWGSEDLLRRILREREDLLCRFQILENEEILELILDVEPLTMEREETKPVNPIH